MVEWDVIIVGGGPAGMSAAINAKAEGLRTLIIETSYKLGGRAETSHAIQNYFGFPSISGRELAKLGRQQLIQFGVEEIRGVGVQKMSFDHNHRYLQLANGLTYGADHLIIATGMHYCKMNIPGEDYYGVFYMAEPLEVEKWANKRVVIIGDENSATQAALNFAHHDAKVTMVSKTPKLRMSSYLLPEVHGHPNIEVKIGVPSSITGNGNGSCRTVTLESGDEIEVDGVVIFAGAHPRTGWIPADMVSLDEKGFIITSPTLESTLSNVWAVGDVRSGSVKRIGSAVGEGTSVVRYILQRMEGRS